MGKTTLVNSIVGVTRYLGGTIALDGRNIARLRPDQRAHAGVGWVPQERNIFKSLTVQENLTAIARPGRWTAKRIYDLFPRLRERQHNLGNHLSGGEQQMLAVGRALMSRPRLLLLDEPSLGLAPVVAREILGTLQRLHAQGLTCLLVEQDATLALEATTRSYVFRTGLVVAEGSSAELRRNPLVEEIYLGGDGPVPC